MILEVENDLLNFALENDIIDLNTIQKLCIMKKNDNYLQQHGKIWQGKNGKWYTYLLNEDGERRLIKRNSKQEIDDLVIQYYKDKEERIYFQQAFYEWAELKLRYKEISVNTYNRYDCDFRNYIQNSILNKKELVNFTKDFVTDFIKSTIADNSFSSKKWANLRIVMRGTLRYAYDKGYTKFNGKDFFNDLELSKRAFSKKIIDYSVKTFSDAEIDKLTEYFLEHESIIGYGILLNFYIGLRPGELSSLKWSDIDGNLVNITRTEIYYKAYKGKYTLEVREFPKTEAGIRPVIIPEKALKYLKIIKTLSDSTDGYIFAKKGKKIAKRAFTARLYDVCDILNIKKRSFDKSRKTYATTLLDNNVPESVVQALMGHTSINTTKQYYYYNRTSITKQTEVINNVFAR